MLRYQYYPTRAGSVPLNYLAGFRGYAQTDGYNGDDGLGRTPGIVMVGNWAHAQRKFHEVLQAAGTQLAKKQLAAEQALEFIGRLYRIERLVSKSFPCRSTMSCASSRRSRF